jgi:hypothetical protein
MRRVNGAVECVKEDNFVTLAFLPGRGRAVGAKPRWTLGEVSSMPLKGAMRGRCVPEKSCLAETWQGESN